MSAADNGSGKFEPLGTSNYATWAVRMKSLLGIKDLWEVVANGLPDGASAADRKKDHRARDYIALNLADQHLTRVKDDMTAKVLWDAFKATYQAESTARRMQLRHELASLRKRADETISAYFTRACALRDGLAHIGHPTEDDTVLHALLGGLPDAFDMIVRIIVSSNEERDLELDKVHAKLLAEEQRLESKAGDTSNGARAMMAKPSGRKVSGKGAKQLECWHCGKTGHRRADCLKLKREQQNGGPSAAFAMTAYGRDGSLKDSRWILDSGASSHMAWDKTSFNSYKPLSGTTISVAADGRGGGGKVAVAGVGSVEIKTIVDGRDKTVVLQDVLHVPTLVVNLFSCGKAVACGAQVYLGKDGCSVKKQGETALQCTAESGVYYVKLARECAHLAHKEESAELWHRRFGHLGYDNLKKLQDGGLVTGVNTPAREFEAQAASRSSSADRQQGNGAAGAGPHGPLRANARRVNELRALRPHALRRLFEGLDGSRAGD
jgi:gag-polypeptide of LTR copia-type/Domain of unknown function (DUF4219)/GAG-pre-integrase domain